MTECARQRSRTTHCGVLSFADPDAGAGAATQDFSNNTDDSDDDDSDNGSEWPTPNFKVILEAAVLAKLAQIGTGATLLELRHAVEQELPGGLALPELSGLASLQTLSLFGCGALTALPELSGLAHLKELDLPFHLQRAES
jgi:hypothetical protein